MLIYTFVKMFILISKENCEKIEIMFFFLTSLKILI